MKPIFFLLPLLLTSSCLATLSAQTIIGRLDPADTLQRHEILTDQGDRFLGRIFQLNEQTIHLRLPDGQELSLLRSRVKTIRVLDGEAPAEETAPLKQVLVTTRGERFVGQVQRMENDTVYFLFQGTTLLRFPMAQVDYITKASEGKSPPLEMEDYPTHTEILLTPTGFGLEAGEWQYRNVMAFYNSVAYGMTDHFSLGAGILPFIGDGAFFLFSISSKLSTEISPSVHLGGGLNLWMATGDGTSVAVIPYAALSFGNETSFLNLSYGRILADEEGLNTLALGGMVRLSPNWQLYLDTNLLFYDDEEGFEDGVFMVMPGASWTKKQNRLNFGLWLGIQLGDAIGIPTATYLRRF